MSGFLSKYDGYTRYMSANTAARREELDRQISVSLTKIDENSELLRELKRLSDEKLEQILSQCEQLEGGKRHDYLQKKLNVTFSMRGQDVRHRELADVLFYYLLRDEEPVHNVRYLFRSMHGEGYLTVDSWYEDCCLMLIRTWGDSDVLFTQVYKRLGNIPSQLEYLLYKQPQLLLNHYSHNLMVQLSQHLPHDSLHQILLNALDKNGQTCMFFIIDWPTELYKNKFDDLCELMSVRNTNGQTVFHATTNRALKALCANITLNNLDKAAELLSIRDNNKKTVHDTARGNGELAWLTNQYERNNYPLYYRPRVLILYNTNDRSGANKEAESIHEALKSIKYSTELHKMGTKREVLQLITQAAADWKMSALIVCMMSHGNIGTIQDSEGNPITLTSIEGAMCSHQLNEKPKILIAQSSCQTRGIFNRSYLDAGATSSNYDHGPRAEGRVDNTPYVPVSDHFLAVLSCVSGQESTRNVFIPYLAEQIENSWSNDHFEDLVKGVSCKMIAEGRLIPFVQSTLRAKICVKSIGWNIQQME